MDHESERKGGEYWETIQEKIVPALTAWSEKDIQAAVGKLEVNAYEIHDYIGAGYRGLFPLASLVNHGCLPNTRMIWSQEPPFRNQMIATRNISEGEELVTSYVRPTMCSLNRRRILKEGW